jgi:cytochrome c
MLNNPGEENFMPVAQIPLRLCHTNLKRQLDTMNKMTRLPVATLILQLVVTAAAHAGGADEPRADPKRGELLFQTCAACHNPLGDGIAPDITGILGDKAAARPGFDYSAALKSSGIVWNEAALKAFIKEPQAVVKGTTMTFPGYSAPADIEAVVADLKTMK